MNIHEHEPKGYKLISNEINQLVSVAQWNNPSACIDNVRGSNPNYGQECILIFFFFKVDPRI